MSHRHAQQIKRNETDTAIEADAWEIPAGWRTKRELFQKLINNYDFMNKPVPPGFIKRMGEEIKKEDGSGIGPAEVRQYLRKGGVPDTNLPARGRKSYSGRGIGEAAVEALLAGKTNEEALAAVLSEFPHANTTLQSIAGYRNDLRKERHDLPSSREVLRRRESPVPQDDLTLIESTISALRAGGAPAEKLRHAIVSALPGTKKKTLLDIFASDAPDSVFEGVFPEDRQSGWREIDL